MTSATSNATIEEFVKPADLFRMRRSNKCKLTPTLQPSPMKCLNNFADPSPTKNLPTLLKNPFKNQPVKRRLNLGRSPSNSPVKRSNINSCSNHSSPKKTPTKRNRMLEMDEDANMEAPHFKIDSNILTPRKRQTQTSCYLNNWTLRTKVKIQFSTICKNWSRDKATTHKRHSGTVFDDDTPSKTYDKTISLEAIRNATSVYQHPYFSWQSLYPRGGSKWTASAKNSTNVIQLTRHSDASQMMHKDWCESLDDLTNLLIDGKCPFFYICSDIYNILFTHQENVQAHISPMLSNFGSELKKLGIQITSEDDNDVENSQSGFEDEVLGRSCVIEDADDTDDHDDDDDDDDNDEDASQFLESLGVTVSQQDFPSIQSKYNKNSNTATGDSNSQSIKPTSQKPLATISGITDIRKLVRFLQTNTSYTITKMGEFACIPPTLLAPCEFRLSTPRYPEVTVGQYKNTITLSPSKESNAKRIRLDDSDTNHNRIDQTSTSSMSSATSNGPRFVEIRGAILPNQFKRLHKLLTVSDNSDHNCSASVLESSNPFKKIPFTNV